MKATTVIIGIFFIVLGSVAVFQGELIEVSVWFIAATAAALGLAGVAQALRSDDENDVAIG